MFSKGQIVEYDGKLAKVTAVNNDGESYDVELINEADGTPKRTPNGESTFWFGSVDKQRLALPGAPETGKTDTPQPDPDPANQEPL